MKPQTWVLIDQSLSALRTQWAEPINADEFDAAFVGLPVSPDYREFVLRYGGAFVGLFPIYGLRLAKAMGTVGRVGTASQITAFFRKQKWPGIETWLIFSIDENGNPMGLAPDQSVWISDGDTGEIEKLADSFEDFILDFAFPPDDAA